MRLRKLLIYKLLREIKNFYKPTPASLKCTFSRIEYIFDEYCGDKKLGIDTDELYSNKVDTSLYQDSHPFSSTPYKALKTTLRYLKLEPNDVFVDFGSGKGRAVFLAACEPIKKAIGVELNDELLAFAKHNLKTCNKPHSPIEFIKADAANFDTSEGTVFFFFNPCGQKTLFQVIENLKASIQKYPRSIRIVNHTAEFNPPLEGQGWLSHEYTLPRLEISVWKNR